MKSLVGGFIIFILSSIFVDVVDSSLTSEQCKSYDPVQLFRSANGIFDTVDDLLVPKQFSRVVDGFLLGQIVGEDTGVASGGGTNIYGFYGTIFLPGDQVLPPGVCSWPSTSDPGTTICNKETGQSMSFSLGQNDVLAILACTPPEVRYFSYDLILSGRTTEEYPYFPGQNFGDTINHYVVNVSSDSVFNSPVLLLHSGDGNSLNTVANAVRDSGEFDPKAINFRQIDTKTIRFWNRSESLDWQVSRPDILAMISRVSTDAANINNSDYKAFKKVNWPVRIYYADDMSISTSPVSPPLKERCKPDMPNEFAIYASLYMELFNAVNASYYSNSNSIPYRGITLSYTNTGFYDDWDVVIAKKDNSSYVAGDRDAAYGMVPEEESQDPPVINENVKIILLGVNHARVYNASFSSVGLDVLCSAVQYTAACESIWFTDDQLFGSARRYFPSTSQYKNNPLIDDLFAVEFYYEGGCQGSQYPQWCKELNATFYPYPVITLGERIYGVKETTVGPCANITLPATAYFFYPMA